MTGAAIGEAIRDQREAILSVAATHGATQVRLIGSVARGEVRPDSGCRFARNMAGGDQSSRPGGSEAGT